MKGRKRGWFENLSPDERMRLRNAPQKGLSRDIKNVRARARLRRVKAEEERYRKINDAQPVKVYLLSDLDAETP